MKAFSLMIFVLYIILFPSYSIKIDKKVNNQDFDNFAEVEGNVTMKMPTTLIHKNNLHKISPNSSSVKNSTIKSEHSTLNENLKIKVEDKNKINKSGLEEGIGKNKCVISKNFIGSKDNFKNDKGKFEKSTDLNTIFELALKRETGENKNIKVNKKIESKNINNKTQSDSSKRKLSNKISCNVINCEECDLKILANRSNVGTRRIKEDLLSKDLDDSNTNYICKKCRIGFYLYNDKCLDLIKLKNFIEIIKKGISNENHKLIDIVTQRIFNQNNNSLETLTNFSEFKLYIDDLKSNTARECQKKINTFIVSFEEHLQTLVELANLVESKNEQKIISLGKQILNQLEAIELKKIKRKKYDKSYKDDKLKNSPIAIKEKTETEKIDLKSRINKIQYEKRNSNKIRTNFEDHELSAIKRTSGQINLEDEELKLIDELFEKLSSMIISSFNEIESKVSKYEQISMKKIIGIHNSFSSKFGFLSIK